MFLGIFFICSMEYLVCVYAASLVGKVVSKRRNGDMIELRSSACRGMCEGLCSP